jgi:hypothetical protein
MTSYSVAGKFRFGNVQGVEQLQYTRSRGAQPGVCTFRIPAEGAPLPTFPSTMRFADGRRSFEFRDCVIGDIALDQTEGDSWIVSVLDRRWRWAFGEISGVYNVRRAGQIIARTRRTPRELASLCFEAMGETRYDVSRMPNDFYPEINWDMEVPAAALDTLCQTVGAVVCPRLNDTYAVMPLGVGADLPKEIGCEFRQSIDFSEVPDALAFAAGPTMWQKTLELWKPVGIEANGKIVPIDKLSYKPTNGWEFENPSTFAGVKDKEARKLAQQCVFKWYQVKLPIELPGIKEPIKTIDELLPLLDHQLEHEFVLGESQRKQAVVYGLYFDRGDTGRNNGTVVSHNLKANKELIYKGGWSIDQQYGLVKFNDPAVYLSRQSQTGRTIIVPAKLFLRCAMNHYDPVTGAPKRWTKTLETGYRNGTKPAWIRRDDVFHEMIVETGSGKVLSNNEAALKEQANYYLKNEVKKYQNRNPQTASYSGFMPIELDGAIAQVTLSIDTEGYATTDASRDSEHSIVVPSFAERQRIIAIKNMLKNLDQLKKINRDRQGVR